MFIAAAAAKDLLQHEQVLRTWPKRSEFSFGSRHGIMGPCRINPVVNEAKTRRLTYLLPIIRSLLKVVVLVFIVALALRKVRRLFAKGYLPVAVYKSNEGKEGCTLVSAMAQQTVKGVK